jgi:hypothetical protein
VRVAFTLPHGAQWNAEFVSTAIAHVSEKVNWLKSLLMLLADMDVYDSHV